MSIVINVECGSALEELCTVNIHNTQGQQYIFDGARRSGVLLKNDNTKANPFSTKNTNDDKSVLCVKITSGKYIVPFSKGIDVISSDVECDDSSTSASSKSFFKERNVSKIDFSFLLKLRDYQEKDVKKIEQSIMTKRCAYFIARPGYGKTTMYTYFISLLKQKTIIVLPNVKLAEQTCNAIKQGLSVKGELNVQILELDKVVKPDTHILVCYINRLQCDSSIFKDFGFLILDEVHMLSTPHGIAALFNIRPNYVFAVTATPGLRDNISEMFVGNNKIYGTETKLWNVAFPCVKIDDIPLTCESKSKCLKFYTNTITELSSSEKYINTLIRWSKYFVKNQKRVMIVTMRIEMNDILIEKLKEHKINSDYLDSKKKKIEIDDGFICDVLIGTYKTLGTGFDEKNFIEDFEKFNIKPISVLIFAGSIKNEALAFQIAGRTFRSNDSLVIFPYIKDIKFSTDHCESIKHVTSSISGCFYDEKIQNILEEL